MIIPIDDPAAVDEAARAIAAGRVIAFPTDTVYGVGADLWQPAAIARLFALKRRPDEKALPVLLAETADWSRVAMDATEAGLALMEAFWPGPLTIVVPRRNDVPDAVGPQVPTIALRVPAHEGLRRVLRRTGPLASSSANHSGEPPAADALAVHAVLGAGVSVVLDGGDTARSQPSTVVDVTGPAPRILRRGALAPEEIARVLALPSEALSVL